MAKSAKEYESSVFLNCPFDRKYQALFRAIVFAVSDCGFLARCALEVDDSSQNRLQKIFRIMSECRTGIHDLSRIELDPATKLPRFNMALELGIFLGAKQFGYGRHRRKSCLVLDSGAFRYRKFVSDISGHDVSFHQNLPRIAVAAVRDFLRNSQQELEILRGSVIHDRFKAFQKQLPSLARRLRQKPSEFVFNDYVLRPDCGRLARRKCS